MACPYSIHDDYDQAYIGRLLSAGLSAGACRSTAALRSLSAAALLRCRHTLLPAGQTATCWSLRLFNVLLGAFAILLLYCRAWSGLPHQAAADAGRHSLCCVPAHARGHERLGQQRRPGRGAAAGRHADPAALDEAALRRGESCGRIALGATGDWRSLLVLGILLGLGMTTKIYAYVALPLAPARSASRSGWRRPRTTGRRAPSAVSWRSLPGRHRGGAAGLCCLPCSSSPRCGCAT